MNPDAYLEHYGKLSDICRKIILMKLMLKCHFPVHFPYLNMYQLRSLHVIIPISLIMTFVVQCYWVGGGHKLQVTKACKICVAQFL